MAAQYHLADFETKLRGRGGVLGGVAAAIPFPVPGLLLANPLVSLLPKLFHYMGQLFCILEFFRRRGVVR